MCDCVVVELVDQLFGVMLCFVFGFVYDYVQVDVEFDFVVVCVGMSVNVGDFFCDGFGWFVLGQVGIDVIGGDCVGGW